VQADWLAVGDGRRIVVMTRKILMLIVTALGAAVVQRRLRAQQAERDLWASATDQPPV
jgi:hypothetical protein